MRFSQKRQHVFQNRLRKNKIRLRESWKQIVYSPNASSTFWKSCTTFGRRNNIYGHDYEYQAIIGGMGQKQHSFRQL